MTTRKFGGTIWAMDTKEIKARLKEIGVSRQELAEKLGVKKRTVDAWLSCGVPIPFAKLQLIEQLLAPPAPEPAPAPAPALGVNAKILNVLLTRDEFELCARAAQKERLPVEEWARRVVLARTAGIQAEKGESTS